MTDHTIWGLVHPDGRAVVWDAGGVASVRSISGTWFFLSAAPFGALIHPQHLSEAQTVSGPEAEALLAESGASLVHPGKRPI